MLLEAVAKATQHMQTLVDASNPRALSAFKANVTPVTDAVADAVSAAEARASPTDSMSLLISHTTTGRSEAASKPVEYSGSDNM
jgi:hypothetical protein